LRLLKDIESNFIFTMQVYSKYCVMLAYDNSSKSINQIYFPLMMGYRFSLSPIADLAFYACTYHNYGYSHNSMSIITTPSYFLLP
jgi:hypothetical protein